tara:strand:+ start:491 stop:1075 length:585 start_codon:yes stop_codon:yes gene_type:complete
LDNFTNFFSDLDKGELKIWDLLAQGVVNKKSKFHTPTLSTVNGNMINSRTIILRKVDNKTKMLFFYSDSRSRKVLNIIQNNNVTVHLYEPRFKLQVQLYGHAKIENKTEKTKDIWSSLRDFSKKNYLSVLSPGEKINNLDDIKYNTDNEEAFYNFSLINFKVSKLECLQLSDIKNIRVEFVYSESSDKKYYMVP